MLKRADTLEQIQERKQEIINVTKTMFETLDYQDITLKSISERTSISRPSLYNYYATKEEILLDIMEECFKTWLSETNMAFEKKYRSNGDLASTLSDIFCKNTTLLRLVSTYLVEIENHVEEYRLVAFKKAIAPYTIKLTTAIAFQFPSATQEERNTFQHSFMMLLHGLYPTACPTDKQVYAMKEAKIYDPISLHDLAYSTLNLLLKIFEK
jgi:AcrR family transcriptional regulator